MSNIYEIQKNYLTILESLEESMLDENISEEVIEKLNNDLTITEIELKEKSLAYAKFIKNTENDLDFIDKEIKRLKKLKQTKENLLQRLKNNILNAFETFNIDKLDLTSFKLSIRKSSSVNSEKFVEYWENKVKNVETTIKDIILNNSQTYADCTDRVKQLFNIEIKITANKNELKKEILATDNEQAFLCFLENNKNITIK